jgi:hypothetical protein
MSVYFLFKIIWFLKGVSHFGMSKNQGRNYKIDTVTQKIIKNYNTNVNIKNYYKDDNVDAPMIVVFTTVFVPLTREYVCGEIRQ